MPTLILWRPLTFWDEEQIKEIKRREVQDKLMKDDEFKTTVSEYRDIEREKDELENELDNKWSELLVIAWKYWVWNDQLYRFI